MESLLLNVTDKKKMVSTLADDIKSQTVYDYSSVS